MDAITWLQTVSKLINLGRDLTKDDPEQGDRLEALFEDETVEFSFTLYEKEEKKEEEEEEEEFEPRSLLIFLSFMADKVIVSYNVNGTDITTELLTYEKATELLATLQTNPNPLIIKYNEYIE